MKMSKLLMAGVVGVAFMLWVGQALAEPVTINWWHAMKGARGEVVDKMIKAFNDSQSDYVVVGAYKGNYDETINAGVSAYRARKQPHLIQAFEVGTQTMMLSGAIYPVFKLMKDKGYNIEWSGYLQPVLERGWQSHVHALQLIHARNVLQRGFV